MAHLPPNHPDRLALADEVHARPPEPLELPSRATYVAVLVAPDDRERERDHVARLCARFDVAPPAAGVTQFSAQLGPVRLKWERHGEFSGYTFFARGASPTPFSEPASSLLPPGWLAAIPGHTMVGAHAKLVASGEGPPDLVRMAEHFEGNIVVGAGIGEGAGYAFTDFRLHADGCSRFVLLSGSPSNARGFTPRQAGRMMQRLFEIEAYRTLALLALPIARRQSPRIVAVERALAELTDGIAREDGNEEALLHELTRLAAEIESGLSASQFRFGATRAYADLVRTRIAELREQRIPGIQTIEEFMARRFTPAVATCTTVSQRLHDLSERVAQASGLLATRVGIAREKQNQALLASMDRRAKLQLRLQQTVEGLSIAAIVYYVAGLVGYLAKGAKAAGLPLDAELAVGVSLPVIALVAWAVIRRAKRHLKSAEPH
ncbi:DUF3422 family protein [Rubrivivax sp. RP6-9]|uniref:DUF3422 family protein n=1 Tax=Rubrivivax sp. RP6-9 TaxID=3415750 RepID=UPI003CC5D61C